MSNIKSQRPHKGTFETEISIRVSVDYNAYNGEPATNDEPGEHASAEITALRIICKDAPNCNYKINPGLELALISYNNKDLVSEALEDAENDANDAKIEAYERSICNDYNCRGLA